MNVLKAILAWIIDAISRMIGAKVTDEKIDDLIRQKDGKQAEADAALKQLADDNQLRTTAANEAANLEKVVAEDTKNVEAATAKTDVDEKALADVKPDKDVKAADLAAKLKDL